MEKPRVMRPKFTFLEWGEKELNHRAAEFYRNWCFMMGWKTASGVPLDNWHALSVAEKEAWTHAVIKLVDVVDFQRRHV